MSNKLTIPEYLKIYKWETTIIVALFIIAFGLFFYIPTTWIDNNNEDNVSCQKVIEDSIIKDQLIEAYQQKDKMVTKLLDNNSELIKNYELTIKQQDELLIKYDLTIQSLKEKVIGQYNHILKLETIIDEG